MKKLEIENSVRQAVTDFIGILPVEVKRETTFEQIGLDSLDKVEFTMELESLFGITIPDDVSFEMTTFGELMDACAKQLASQTDMLSEDWMIVE